VRTQVYKAVFSGNEMDKLRDAQLRPGIDSREQPLYTLREAAYYLGVKLPTLKTWFYGRHYPTASDPKKPWERVFIPADENEELLSFNNLAEAHVLAATRYEHEVPFKSVREAIKHIASAGPRWAKHPLLSNDFLTNGYLLFVKELYELKNVTNEQLSLQEVMKEFVVRVISDDRGPFKIFPLANNEPKDRVISIRAGVCGSRPVLDGTRIPVHAILRRINAGEDRDFIADDYDIKPELVERVRIYGERRAA
jgi:uncharacterized protein (DUF433 family)